MNHRRRIVVGIAGVLAPPPIVFAQKPQKVARIGWLTPGTRESGRANVDAFREGLRALGHVEGKNVVIDYRFAEGKTELFPVLAAELVRLNPDCILAGGYPTIRALMRLTKTIPIVLGNLDSDPVEEGIIASLARPGGNVTGLIGIQWELAGKRLELLREVAPKASRVAVLFDPRTRSGQAHVEQTQIAARKLGMQLQLLEAREPADIDRAFKAAREGRAEAISVIHVGVMQGERPRIARLAIEVRLPAVYSATTFPADGGLMAYAPDTSDQYRRAAVFVDKILKGAKPADLPVEQPTQFELVVNMKTAKALGITIPQTILIRADRVIE
jgi:putative ABC transport system substrate-binding protein